MLRVRSLTHTLSLRLNPSEFCVCGVCRTLPKLVWLQMFAVLFNTSLFVLPWPLMPLFLINTEIYIQLYFIPFLTAVLVKRTLLPTNTQHRP